MYVRLSGSLIDSKLRHAQNALDSIDLTVFGIVMCFILLHQEKVPLSILLILSGITNSIIELQSLKAFFPIDVKDSGSLIVARFLQLAYLQPVITQCFASNKSEIWS